MQKTQKELFYCYSNRLNQYLKLLGFEIQTSGKNLESGNQYWSFERSEDLDFALRKWNELKQRFDGNKIHKKLSGKVTI